MTGQMRLKRHTLSFQQSDCSEAIDRKHVTTDGKESWFADSMFHILHVSELDTRLPKPNLGSGMRTLSKLFVHFTEKAWLYQGFGTLMHAESNRRA